MNQKLKNVFGAMYRAWKDRTAITGYPSNRGEKPRPVYKRLRIDWAFIRAWERRAKQSERWTRQRLRRETQTAAFAELSERFPGNTRAERRRMALGYMRRNWREGTAALEALRPAA